MSNVLIAFASQLIGTAEVHGAATNSSISSWLKSLKAPFTDDETPWCGTFAAYVCQQVGYSYPKLFYRALEWANYGTAVDKPYAGSIAVFSRVGGGHVGIVVGVAANGDLAILGGNQNDAVRVSLFKTTNLKALRWPPSCTDAKVVLPYKGSADLSTKQA